MLTIDQSILIDLAYVLARYMESKKMSGLKLTRLTNIHAVQIASVRKIVKGERDFSKIKLHYTALVKVLMQLGFNITLRFENKNYYSRVEWPLERIC